jgi:hypothetical protein
MERDVIQEWCRLVTLGCKRISWAEPSEAEQFCMSASYLGKNFDPSVQMHFRRSKKVLLLAIGASMDHLACLLATPAPEK